jgi:hypothetical protein
MTENQANMSPEEIEKKFKEWSQSEYVKVSKFCGSKGYQVKSIDQTKCQALPPVLGVWYVTTTEKNVDLWAISGDFPTDIVGAKAAKNARDVLRYFSMTWHVQAVKLEEGVTKGQIAIQDDDTQTKLAAQLTTRAESLYDLYNNDELWKATGLEK